MSLHHQYNGFEVYAHAYESSRGYVPSVTLTRGDPANIAERKFGPPVRSPVATKEEALDIAMRYGRDLVDGRIPGFDARSML